MAWFLPLLFLFINAAFWVKTIADPITAAGTSTTAIADPVDQPFNYSQFTKQPYFVDKSDLLREFFEHNGSTPQYPVYFITCPPGFGKNVNLEMIKQFFQIQLDPSKKPVPSNETYAYNTFKNLTISRHNDFMSNHLAHYPVISLDLLDIAILGLKIENVLDELHYRIEDSINNFIGFDHLLQHFKSQASVQDEDAEMSEVSFLEGLKDSNLDEHQMEYALYMLTKSYYEYFNKTKVIVLITKYDSTALSFFRNSRDSNVGVVYKLLNEILKRTFDLGRNLIEFGVITSTTMLSYCLDNSMHDMIVAYRFLDTHRFTSHFGFTENDLQHLFTVYNCDEIERKRIRTFYRAYQSTDKQLVYNPYSISEYFRVRKNDSIDAKLLQGHWSKVGTFWKHIFYFLKNQLFREKIGILIQSRQVQHPLRKDYDWNALFQLEQLRDRNYEESEDCHVDMFFTFYFEQGLLSHTNETDVFDIPNNEAQLAYEHILRYYHKPATTTAAKSFNTTSTTPMKSTS